MVEIEDVYKAFGTLDDSRESESKLPACKGNVVGAFCRQVFLWLSRASYLPLVEQSFVSEKEDERKLFDGCPHTSVHGLPLVGLDVVDGQEKTTIRESTL